MRPHCYLIALAVISLCGAAAAQPVRWQRYEIPQTGASVDVPTSVFNSDAGQTQVGYGRRFASMDQRANLTVQSVPNNTGDTPATFLAKKKPPPGIQYKRVTSRFFAVSSVRNDETWYDRCNFSGHYINCVLINYPAAEERQWDDIVTRISLSLSGR
jgi:hypothetical protein